MSIFDLIFLLSVLISVVTPIFAAIAGIRGRRGGALRILCWWGTGVLIYLASALLVSFAAPQRVIAIGDPWCFDDWCLTVEGVKPAAAGDAVAYQVALRISSEARRVSQRAQGAWIYLIDDAGHRYAPDSDPSVVPLDVRLGPQESVATSRTFRVPGNVAHLGLITGHGGPYCRMEVLIIGSGGCVFNKPAMIRIR